MSNEEKNLGDQQPEETGAETARDEQAPETPVEGGADTDALGQAQQILDDAARAEEASASGEMDAEGLAAEYKEDLQRLQAEFTNYRRRVERDKKNAHDEGLNKAVASLIPVLDDIDAARAHGDLEDGPFAAIADKLERALGSIGFERIDETGVEFDPTIHEAMLRQPVEGVQEDHVGQVFRIGFKRGDRVLRAAQVMVSTGE